MKTLIFILIFAPTAFANGIVGTWNGKGVGRSDNGWNEACPLIKITTQRTEKQFWIKAGQFQCGSVSVKFEPFALDVVSDSLFYKGQKIGEIKADKVSLKLERPGSIWIWSATLKPDGTVDYLDRLENGSRYFEITGTLREAK